MKYLGLDAHSNTCTLACLTHHGHLADCKKFGTSASNLINAVGSVKGKKILTVEESHMAAWMKATLKRHVDKLIVCDPKHNKWISHDEHEDDKVSAIKLAKLLRGGYVKEIYHPEGESEKLRSLFLQYYDLTKQQVRFKCKLKAEFRQLAIKVEGDSVYNPQQRSKWLTLLQGKSHVQVQVEQSYQLIDMFEKMKATIYKKMISLAKKEPAYRLLIEIPGVGPVLGSGYIAIIVTPHRFSRKNKLWRYAGLSNQRQVSDGIVYKHRPTRTGNRVLKWITTLNFKGAVLASSESNRFRRRYHKLVTGGESSKAARRIVCRHILSTVRAMWMKGEAYRDTINEEPVIV